MIDDQNLLFLSRTGKFAVRHISAWANYVDFCQIMRIYPPYQRCIIHNSSECPP
jgi:hypothetical protein